MRALELRRESEARLPFAHHKRCMSCDSLRSHWKTQRSSSGTFPVCCEIRVAQSTKIRKQPASKKATKPNHGGKNNPTRGRIFLLAGSASYPAKSHQARDRLGNSVRTKDARRSAPPADRISPPASDHRRPQS